MVELLIYLVVLVVVAIFLYWLLTQLPLRPRSTRSPPSWWLPSA